MADTLAREAGKTYKEKLYQARSFDCSRGGSSSGIAFSRLSDLMRKEGIIDAVRKNREFVRPGQMLNLERMASRKRRFDELHRNTIHEILDMNRRFQVEQ